MKSFWQSRRKACLFWLRDECDAMHGGELICNVIMKRLITLSLSNSIPPCETTLAVFN